MKKINPFNSPIMKTKSCLILILSIFFTVSSWSQIIEITPTYGYQFGSKLNYGANYLKAQDSDQFGITIGVEADDDMMVELSYTHHSTELRIRDIYISPIEDRLTDLYADWIMIGVSRYFGDGKLKPFLGGSLGVVFLSNDNVNYDIVNYGIDNNSKFAFAFKGGANYMFTETVGINLQGGMMVPVTWGGVYVGGGSGGGYGGVSVSGSTIIGYVSGGLVFRVGS